MIFVFGSNLKGIHGKGAALEAKKKHGAIQRIGRGPQGNSYAIPTKATPYESLSLYEIAFYIDEFLDYAEDHPHLEFEVTPIGCGLAGYKPEQIAPLFNRSLPNVHLPTEFLLGD